MRKLFAKIVIFASVAAFIAAPMGKVNAGNIGNVAVEQTMSVEQDGDDNFFVNLIDDGVSGISGVISDAFTDAFCMTSYAATTASNYWSQDSAGNWVISKPGVGKVTNAWVCDNKNNPSDVNSNWYLMDGNGIMYTGIIHDAKDGNYYLLNPSHDGNYGMMISGVSSYNYNGVTVTLNTAHDGSYGKITNWSSVSGQLSQYVKEANTSGAGNEYTADWGNGYGSGSSSGGSSGVNGVNVNSGSSSGGVTVNSGSGNRKALIDDASQAVGLTAEEANYWNQLGQEWGVRFN